MAEETRYVYKAYLDDKDVRTKLRDLDRRFDRLGRDAGQSFEQGGRRISQTTRRTRDDVRKLGFALDRFGVRGTAAFGEIIAVAGAAGIAIGGVLITVNLLVSAFRTLARIGVDTLKSMTSESIRAGEKLDTVRATFDAVFEGNTQASEAALNRIRRVSTELGQDLTETARVFLPDVENLDQLEQVLEIATALARFQPEQGTSGARIALQELLQGGETRSLVKRFEISQTVARSVKDRFEAEGLSAALEELQAELERTGRSVDDLGDTLGVRRGQAEQYFERLAEIAGAEPVEELKKQFDAFFGLLDEGTIDVRDAAERFGDLVAHVIDLIGTDLRGFLSNLDPTLVADLTDALGDMVDSGHEFAEALLGEDAQRITDFLNSLPEKIDKVAFRLENAAEKLSNFLTAWDAFTGRTEEGLERELQTNLRGADSVSAVRQEYERILSVSQEIAALDVWGPDVPVMVRRETALALSRNAASAEEFVAAVQELNELSDMTGDNAFRVLPNTSEQELARLFERQRQIASAGTASEIVDVWQSIGEAGDLSARGGLALFAEVVEQLALASDNADEFQERLEELGFTYSQVLDVRDEAEVFVYYNKIQRGAEAAAAAADGTRKALIDTDEAGEGAANAFMGIDAALRAMDDRLVKVQDNLAGFREELAELNDESAERLETLNTQSDRAWEDYYTDALNKRVDLFQKHFDKLDDIQSDYEDKVEDSEVDLGDKLEDIAIERGRKRLELAKEEAEALAEVEEEYQDQVAEIRRKANFDAFEAALNNDALRIRQIRRQEAFDINEAGLDRDESEQDAIDAAKEKRDELKQQLQYEIEDANLAQQRKLRDLETWLDRQIEEQELAKQRELDQLVVWEQRKRDELKLAHDRRMEDYNDWWRDKYAAIEDKYGTERDLIAEQMQLTTDRMALELKRRQQTLRRFEGSSSVYSTNPELMAHNRYTGQDTAPSIAQLRQQARLGIQRAGLPENIMWPLLRETRDASRERLVELLERYPARAFGGVMLPGQVYRFNERASAGIPELIRPMSPMMAMPWDQATYRPPANFGGGVTQIDRSIRQTLEVPYRSGFSAVEKQEIISMAAQVYKRLGVKR